MKLVILVFTQWKSVGGIHLQTGNIAAPNHLEKIGATHNVELLKICKEI